RFRQAVDHGAVLEALHAHELPGDALDGGALPAVAPGQEQKAEEQEAQRPFPCGHSSHPPSLRRARSRRIPSATAAASAASPSSQSRGSQEGPSTRMPVMPTAPPMASAGMRRRSMAASAAAPRASTAAAAQTKN